MQGLQEWEKDPESPLEWCGNFHPGGNGHPPANILNCGGAVCILFGGMRLLDPEEKQRSNKRKADKKAAREAKKKTKRKRSAGSTAKFLELAQAAAQERVAGQL